MSTSTTPSPDRVVSLDAYRGFTMLAMVSGGLGLSRLLDDPTWGWLADQLRHRDWEGCTFWDLIQPSFMFIVGAAMPFSFARRQERGDSWTEQLGHVLARACLLCLLGMFLDSYHHNGFVVQFIRVLQQIALAYILAFFFLGWPWVVQLGGALLILVLHTLAYQQGASGPDPWLRDNNIGTCIDRYLHDLFGGHSNIFPLSTGGYVTFNAFSSAATILLGVLAGRLLQARRSTGFKVLVLVLAGAACLAAGWYLQPVVPMVKRLWTASFALWAAGWTWLMLAGFFAVIDGWKWRAWAFPLVVVGMNSIFIYVSAGVLGSNVRKAVGLLTPAIDAALERWLDLGSGSAWVPVVLACLGVLVQWSLCYWLYRQKIFFKV